MVDHPAGESICTDDIWLWYHAFNENDMKVNKNCKYNASNKGRKLRYQKGVTFLTHAVGYILVHVRHSVGCSELNFSVADSVN